MTEFLDKGTIKKVLDEGIQEAEKIISDPDAIDNLLISLEEKMRGIPTVGTTLAQVPLMVSMVKSYITKEYPEVSIKVVATLVGAFIYLVKDVDFIPDHIKLIGHVDDLAVVALALKLCEPELNAYSQWRKENM